MINEKSGIGFDVIKISFERMAWEVKPLEWITEELVLGRFGFKLDRAAVTGVEIFSPKTFKNFLTNFKVLLPRNALISSLQNTRLHHFQIIFQLSRQNFSFPVPQKHVSKIQNNPASPNPATAIQIMHGLIILLNACRSIQDWVSRSYFLRAKLPILTS